MKILDDITVYICQDARRNNKIYDKTRCLSYQTYLVYFSRKIHRSFGMPYL